MNKKVIYTSMFGTNNDLFHLHEPESNLDGWDLVCFTDNPNIKSDKWDVRLVTRYYTDGARDNRLYKMLPHRHLSDYEISVCIDADLIITKDISDIVTEYLKNTNLAVLDHSICGMTKTGDLNRRNCIYQEAKFIKWLGDNHPRKKYKDNLDTIFNQVNRYKDDGYPEDNGLARTTVIFRKHNEKDVINSMESWWLEYKYNSRRDQLSFPYVMWKTKLNFTYMPIDIDDNEWFKLMKKWRTNKMKEVKTEYEPISLDYFLNMEVANGGVSKSILKNNDTLKTVRDTVVYYSNEDNVREVESKLEPSNWQYFNCMMAGFRHDVADHHELGWDNLTKEYYDSLKPMTDEEILEFNKKNPVEFDNGFIKHSYHRAYAMIGRLIKGKKYIPFYMIKNQIYDEPRQHDNIQRVKPLVNNVKNLLNVKIPKEHFTVCQSGVLSLMGIRQNDDLDIIISSQAREQLFNNSSDFIRQDGLEIFEPNRVKFQLFGAQGDDDLIKNYSFQINGFNFLEPRFYFSRKNKHTDRDKFDWDGMRRFFGIESHKGYPFNQLTEEQWGIQYI